MTLDREATPAEDMEHAETYNSIRSMVVDIYADLARIYTQLHAKDTSEDSHAYIVSNYGGVITVDVSNSGYPDEYYSLRHDGGVLLLTESQQTYNKEEIICYHRPPHLMVRHAEEIRGVALWTPYFPVTDEASVQKVLDYTDDLHVEIIAVTDEEDPITEQKRGIGGFVRKMLTYIAK
jgi:hypothetical protein